MRVAVLGTGRMGAAIARRLDGAGFAVQLWNRTPERAIAIGVGEVFDTPQQAVAGADVALSMLTGPEAVRDVWLGKAGILHAGGARERGHIDMSTAGPDVAAELELAATQAGARFVAAPVVGSIPAVESGQLLVLAGGDARSLDAARPVLKHLGEVCHVGTPPDAARLKLVANSFLAVITAAAGELLSAATQSRLREDVVWPVLTRLAPGLDARRAGYLEHRYQPAMFRLADIVKDLNLAHGALGVDGVSLPLTEAARAQFEAVVAEHADDDVAAIVERYRAAVTPGS
jgi:3-hydroxyisobutyrate dehydrogenase